jgi:hypothetical protein
MKETMGSVIDVNVSSEKNKVSLQFWKLDRATEDSSQSTYIAMAPPIYFDQNNEQEDDLYEHQSESYSSCYELPPSQSPIDDVVRMAIESGCEACIVSSHREELRELYKHKCKFTHRRRIPYCCIGIFEVAVVGDNAGYHQFIDGQSRSTSLSWILHEMLDPNEMPKQTICDILQRYNSPVTVASESFAITYPVIERTTLMLCEASLVLDDLATQQSVVSIHKISLTGAGPASSNHEDNIISFELNLEITLGYHSWLEFLHRVQEDVVHGTVEFSKLHSQSNIVKTGKVLVRPDKQSALPCPPKTIRIEIHCQK